MSKLLFSLSRIIDILEAGKKGVFCQKAFDTTPRGSYLSSEGSIWPLGVWAEKRVDLHAYLGSGTWEGETAAKVIFPGEGGGR